jgi:hypothetical protein
MWFTFRHYCRSVGKYKCELSENTWIRLRHLNEVINTQIADFNGCYKFGTTAGRNGRNYKI